jgi:hypothetical protein
MMQRLSSALRRSRVMAGMIGCALLALSAQGAAKARAAALVGFAPVAGGTVLADRNGAAPIIVDPADATVVHHAASDLAADLAAVTGQRPIVATAAYNPGPAAIFIGTLGKSAVIDRLVATRRLDVCALRGAWESWLIVPVRNPAPGVARGLAIIGSDRRGTAYGAYELARAIGVSPWTWWADLPPRHHDGVYVLPGARRFGPPSVKYRGIFVNDEDWGLYPWAARTFDPAYGNIGPRTYARIFELMLRLKANTLWPAMHKTTRAFNNDPANARLADDYAIIMGSSHAEPMLRNNVGEWPGDAAGFNYATNPDGVRSYWQSRVAANAGYENLWTLGMRGIHDSRMVGPESTADRVKLLDKVIADQRAMLAAGVPGGLRAAPQIFVPYKEVLDLYRAGLHVPEDVTIVWPDDNYGYIRQFPDAREAHREGGAGIYYHLSYLGYPLAYLWLATTPPALVQEEMLRAWDTGARRLWMVNVGDIKPAEIGISHFLDMAWDTGKARAQDQHGYLAQWLTEAFGSDIAAPTADLLDIWYRLNSVRRPEHLEWPAHGEDRHLSDLSPAQVNDRLRQFRKLVADTAALGKQVPADRRDAWFELVEYPVRAAAAANMRFFAAERFDELIETDPSMARSAGGAVAAVETEIANLTQRYNAGIRGGKWSGIMLAEPADSQWQIYRPRPVVVPAPDLRDAPDRFYHAIDAAEPAPVPALVMRADLANPDWRWIAGLGRGVGALVAHGANARLTLPFVREGPATAVFIDLVPLFPEGHERELALDVAIDDGTPIRITVPRVVGDIAWTQGVLDNRLHVALPLVLPVGAHRLTLIARMTGVALEQVIMPDASDGRALQPDCGATACR